MPLLHAGDAFPNITVILPGGDLVSVPAWFAGDYGVVLFSRGASCRACVEQQRAFQRSTARFETAGIRVVAVSSDDEATTSELISKYGLTYPLGHSADPQSISDATGAFVSLEPPLLQSTGFVLDPSGNVIISLYSCGAIGQLLPDDVLELIRDLHASTVIVPGGDVMKKHPITRTGSRFPAPGMAQSVVDDECDGHFGKTARKFDAHH